MSSIWNFAAPEPTEARLRARRLRGGALLAGAQAGHPARPAAFTMTVTLGPQLARLPEELRQPFAEAVIAQSPSSR